MANIAKIETFTPPTLKSELITLANNIQAKVARGDTFTDPNWDTLSNINNIEKSKQLGSFGKFLPTINLPGNALKGKRIDLGNGNKILLNRRLGYSPLKLYIDFGYDGNKNEVRFSGDNRHRCY